MAQKKHEKRLLNRKMNNSKDLLGTKDARARRTSSRVREKRSARRETVRPRDKIHTKIAPFPSASTAGSIRPLPFAANSFSYLTAFWWATLQSILVIYKNSWSAHVLSPEALPKALFLLQGSDERRHFSHDQSAPTFQAGTLFETLIDAGRRITRDFLINNPDKAIRFLLEVMGLFYSSNRDLRKHIKNIEAKYQFVFADRNTPIAAEIRSGRIRVMQGFIDTPNVSLQFRNADALRKFFLSAKPDILAAVLEQDIRVKGNLTYLYKLAFLGRHIQRKFVGDG